MSKLNIKVGQSWRTRDGSSVVVHCDDGNPDYPINVRRVGDSFASDDCGEYTYSVSRDGEERLNLTHDDDLVALNDPTGHGVMILSADPVERKSMPITTGVLDYFPLALAEVAKVSKAGNDQHNPGQPLHWDKTKSLDHADCIPRHLIDRKSRDTDGQRHSAKLAWRALALLQTELEQEAANG